MTLYDAEVANVLWKYIKAGYIDEQNAQLTMALLLKLVDSYSDTSELAVDFGHAGSILKISSMYNAGISEKN